LGFGEFRSMNRGGSLAHCPKGTRQMPIVTVTENEKTIYYPVHHADECRVDAVVDEYKLNDGSNSREYAEHALRKEYLKRLTEHAYDCVTLRRLLEAGEPGDDEPTRDFDLVGKLALKIAHGAIWLRTYEPFAGLTCDVGAATQEDGTQWGTCMEIDCTRPHEKEPDIRRPSALDDASWPDTEHALWAHDPWHRDHFARIEAQRAAEREAGKREYERDYKKRYTPSQRRKLKKARDMILAIADEQDAKKKSKSKTVANKRVRRKAAK
jgi:hypothetical protein